jgi:hypothetical protein
MPSFTVSSSQAFDDLARNHAEKRASRTLLAATQAFIATPLHDRRSRKQYNELFRHFFPKTSIEDRQAVARLIASSKDAPKDALLLLCCDEESVACQILLHSPLLDEETLTTQILHGTTRKREAIANREDITFSLASQLISFAEPSVLMDLEQHIDKLPEIAERLHDILGAESEMAELQQGSTTMEPNDQDYDKLVADMERDWYEHYHPEELVAAEERMLSASDDAMAEALEKPQDISDSRFDEPSLRTDTMSDELPPSDLHTSAGLEAELDDEDEAPKRFSFSIFAEDEENAAIPPLEATDDSVRTASIQFKQPLEQEAEHEASSTNPSMVSDTNPVEHGSPRTSDPSFEDSTAPLSSEIEEQPQSRGRITFEIRSSKSDEAISDRHSNPKAETLRSACPHREEDKKENLQLGPAPAPFVPRHIPQRTSDADWEQALAHLSKPANELPEARTSFGVRSPADRGTPAVRERTALPQIAPQVEVTPQPTQSAEATISFTRMQSAPISLKAPSSSETDRNETQPSATNTMQTSEREAQISIPTGPRRSESERSAAVETMSATRQVSEETQQSFIDKASLPRAVMEHTIFAASEIKECVLVENPGPHGETLEAFAEKAALAKPELPVSQFATTAQSDIQAPSQDTLDAFAHKADLGKPDISSLLNDLNSIEPPQLKTGIPVALRDSETVQDEDMAVIAQTAIERAAGLSKLGFMPSVIDLEDLELVEAIPDMPSASEAMMDHVERATPAIELVEPIEVYFADEKTFNAESDQSPMMIVAAQIEAERNQATLSLEDERAQSDISVMSDEVVETTNPILQIQAEAQAQQDEVLDHEAAQVHISIRRKQVDELVNEAGDLTDLPELSHHQIVEADDLAAMKDNELAIEREASRSIAVAPRPAARQTGSMDQFLAFDEETRLAILQSLISATVPMDRAERFQRWPQGRPQLAEKQSSALLMARFASDTDTVAQVMHEISGHQKSDMIKLLQDPGGEALIAYLASVGLDESRALSMVLHAPDALSHSYDKVSKLMTLFDQMHPAASLAIVEQLLGAFSRNDAPQTQHMPLQDEGLGTKAPRLRGTQEPSDSATDREPTITFGRRNSNKF